MTIHKAMQDLNIENLELQKYLNSFNTTNATFADLYFQKASRESWSLKDNKISDNFYASDLGVGVRFVSGEKTGFAYTNDLTDKSLLETCKTAKILAKNGNAQAVNLEHKQQQQFFYDQNPLLHITNEQKQKFLTDLNVFARSLDKDILEVDLSFSSSFSTCVVANTFGLLQFDNRPLTRFVASILIKNGDKKEIATQSFGNRNEFNLSQMFKQAQETIQEALRVAKLNLIAEDAPAGTFDVVFSNGWSGVLLHEAVGHGLEADFNRKKTSVYTDKIGQQVASEICTLIDDGTVPNHTGSLNIDDEGFASQKNILIENGILKGYMQDLQNSILMETKQTGNGRRQSYKHLPMPRMTNTYMQSGTSKPSDIIANTQKGIYCATLGGGQVDITSGKFVFATSEAYLIENGKITKPIKNATIIGDGLEVLQNIVELGDDSILDNGTGTCGKAGQSVAVGIGQPTTKVKGLTVGGTKI